MRESVGGTLLLQIVLVFLTVYIGFMAIVINYGKVFRYKNAIVNRIEQNEGYADCEAIDTMIKEVGYLNDYKVSYTTNAKGAIYKVEIFIIFNLPLVKTQVRIPVRGETRLIDTAYNDLEADNLVCPIQ